MTRRGVVLSRSSFFELLSITNDRGLRRALVRLQRRREERS
jgi:hypothetical protein